MESTGEPVIISYSSTDTTTVGSLVLRNAGTNTNRTLAANERLVIQSLSYSLAAAVLHVSIFDDADAGGTVSDNLERLAELTIGSGHCSFLGTDGGLACGLGRIPKVIGAVAGIVRIAGVGVIRNT